MANKTKAVVSKFGGTSMNDAKAMLQSAQVAMTQGSCLVVVSATSGTTNDLIELGQASKSGLYSEAQAILLKIVSRHEQIAADLNADTWTLNQVRQLFSEMEAIATGISLLKDCSPRALDVLVSFGERISSVLFVEALRAKFKENSVVKKVQWFDVREVLLTDDQFGKAKPMTTEIIERCKTAMAVLKTNEVVMVTQGFIGMTEDGLTTTLGRGGSDYSGAILAEGIGADVLEIWTDVAGIATTDPRICKEAKAIPEISFREASELATFGAKVLHPATLMPAMRQQIPVYVANTFAPEKGGTWIRQNSDQQPLVRAFAIKKKQVLVTLSTPEMSQAHGFLFRIFKIFNDNKVSIDAITTSEISVSLTLDDSTLLNKNLLADLADFADVQSEENLSLISLIGNNINHTAGLAHQIFEALGDINVRMICLGASKHNFCFVVSEAQGEEAIRRLHRRFVER